MRRLVLLALVTAASPALAQPAPPAPPVAAPAGWVDDPAHAQVVHRDAVLTMPGGSKPELTVWSFRAPTGGGQVIVWEGRIGVGPDPGGFVRTRLEDLRRTPEIVAAGGGAVSTRNWQERALEQGTLVEANLEWSQDEVGIVSVVRALWTRPETPTDLIVERRVECVLGSPDLRAACDQAIAALAPPPGPRASVELKAAAAEAAEEVVEGEPPAMREAPPSTGPVVVAPPKAQESRDLRPFYVAGFILVVVAVLWWSRRRRAEILKEEEGATSDSKAEPEPAPAPSDEENRD